MSLPSSTIFADAPSASPVPSMAHGQARRQAMHGDRVLIVDDAPGEGSPLRDALEESGHAVLFAHDGASALRCAAQAQPDIVLLEVRTPGLDGFEVARRLKADAATAHIPIIFLTEQAGTEHLVAALDAGASDYVAKPIRPREVLARMQVHLRSARERRQARNALDAFGYASLTVRVSDGRLMWQTPLARTLMQRYGGMDADAGAQVAPAVLSWLRHAVAHVRASLVRGEPLLEPPQMKLVQGACHLLLRLQQDNGDSEDADWLVILQEVSDQAVIEALALRLRLTAREAEVLYWVGKGKINRDIGDILGSSPMTVKKHLERVYAKLGVETRTAAAAMALARMRIG